MTPATSSFTASAEAVTLLLFLHARPCRAYTRAYLERRFGVSCAAALDHLVRSGLVARSPAEPDAFAYGAEHPQLLCAVDELSRRYHAVCALLRMVAALTRGRGRGPALLTKPKQSAPSLRAEHLPARPRRARLRKRFPCFG